MITPRQGIFFKTLLTFFRWNQNWGRGTRVDLLKRMA